MAQREVLVLNEAALQLQAPQAGDTYLLPRDTEVQGNLAVTGTVDGVDVAVAGAQAGSALQAGSNISLLNNNSNYADDQTGTEIKAALFAEADTNNFSDAASTKLTGIATGAQVNVALASQAEAEAGIENTKTMTALRVAQTIAVFSTGLLNKYDATSNPVATNDVNDGYSIGSIWINHTPDEIYFCIDNSAATAIWVKISLTVDELAAVAVSGDSDDLAEGAAKLLLTVAERAKLTGIEAAATADQTGAEIKALYEAEADTNAFTNVAQTKVSWLEGVTAGITAFATGGQASAVALTTRFNHVGTVAAGGDSVKLPTAVAGKLLTVVNKGASAMDLFPATGDNINGTGVDLAVSVAIGASATLWAADTTNWYYA